jgi:hypothetical protein
MARMRKVKLAPGLEIEVGSGNVYKDLGFKNADAMLASLAVGRGDACRSRLLEHYSCIIRAERFSPNQALAGTVPRGE